MYMYYAFMEVVIIQSLDLVRFATLFSKTYLITISLGQGLAPSPHRSLQGLGAFAI